MSNKAQKLEEVMDKIRHDPDWICNKKHGNSLKSFLDKNPNGATDRQIALLLKTPLEEIDEIYEDIILKLRQGFEIKGQED